MPYPEETDRRSGLTKIAEMGISAIPGVGGPLQIAFAEAAGRRLAERRTQWLHSVTEEINGLSDRLGSVEQLVYNDTFMDALTTASQIADRTSQAEKIALLRNAVVNSTLPGAPDDDTQQLFFTMIDRFTPTHMRLLILLSDPAGWFSRHNLARPNVAEGHKSVIVEAGIPTLAARPDLIDRYAAALIDTGLVNSGGMMGAAGLWTPATTPLAAEFLDFIVTPQTRV
ncbi:hypothetical protein ACFY36_11685 [Actinoplanes sp. NPDC000266]